MPPATNTAFRTCLKFNIIIKLGFNAAVVCITYEGINSFFYLADFDSKSIESLPTICKEKILAITDDPEAVFTAVPAVPGANISLIVIGCLIVAVQYDKYYTYIGMTMNARNINYSNVFSSFKIGWDNYEELKK